MNNITIGIETMDKIIAKIRSVAYLIGRTLLEEDKTVNIKHDYDNNQFIIFVDNEACVTLNYLIVSDPDQTTLTETSDKDVDTDAIEKEIEKGVTEDTKKKNDTSTKKKK